MSFKDIEKLCEEKTANRITCKNCGHTMNIPASRDKKICSHCGIYVFKEDKEEFKYRLLNSYKGAERMCKTLTSSSPFINRLEII